MGEKFRGYDNATDVNLWFKMGFLKLNTGYISR